MRWTPWLLACVSLLLFACATASEPLLTATLTLGTAQTKRAVELRGRDYTATVTTIGLDKRPSVRTASGTLEKSDYQRLIKRYDALDMTAFKELYTGRDIQLMGAVIFLRITCKGVTKTVTVVGAPPPEVEPLLGPLLPLLDRVY